VEAQYPGGKVTLESRAQYYNMKEKIDARPEVLATLRQAAANLGIDAYLKPIRGGTDGSRLTELGIPTPNIFTGGRNWHSRTEWAAVSDMIAASKLVIELVRLWADSPLG
jgi:tripeptide aminopeptidase